MKTPRFEIKILEGKIHVINQKIFDEYLTKFKPTDKVEMIVKRFKNTRTLKQNAYLWGVVYKVISEYSGETCDDLHLHFKMKFLKEHGKSGKLSICKSTTKLDTKGMTDYIDQIIRWAGDFGLEIPTPDEYYSVNY